MKIRFFVLLFIFLTLFHSSGKAIEQQNVLYAKNYLLILVHGVGDDYACLAKIRDHLISNGLDGYVHIYQFSDPFLNIEKEGREFGDRNYKERPEVCVNRPDDKKNDVIDQETKNSDYEKHYWKLTKRPDKTVNSWLEQGKNDFIEWFKDPKRNKNNPSGRAPIDSSGPDNEIPKKYIIIAHSMGGLAVRSYILGKDQRGNRYYQNDIEKLITIDTPHKGSGAASFAKSHDNTFTSSAILSLGCLGLAVANSMAPGSNDNLTYFFAAMFGISWMNESVAEAIINHMERHRSPAMDDLIPSSVFLQSLNSTNYGDDYDEIKYRLIGGNGVPTPLMGDEASLLVCRFNPISLLIGSIGQIFFNPHLETYEGRLLGAYATTLSGYPIYEDGDMVVDRFSQMGEGIANITNPKRYLHTFRSPSLGAIEFAIPPGADYFLGFLPGPAKVGCYIGFVMAAAETFVADESVNPLQFLYAHKEMIDEVVGHGSPILLEQALFDAPVSGSSSIKTINPQGLMLATNQTKEADGKITILSAYHPVEVKGYSYDNRSNTNVPIVIDGQEQKITAIMVKEAPTKISGVLRDFMPSKMQYFQYSENFAAWKPVPKMDEWGNFEVDGLKLAEGQNVIAFRAKNKVGYESNQLLKVILNTIPMQPSQFKPLPEYYVAIANPEISVEFNKSEYTGDYDSEKITIKGMTFDGEEVAPQVESTMEAYHPWAKASYKANGLSDGEHKVAVRAESNVGVTQVYRLFAS